jgi:ribosomal protein L6P/L9E
MFNHIKKLNIINTELIVRSTAGNTTCVIAGPTSYSHICLSAKALGKLGKTQLYLDIQKEKQKITKIFFTGYNALLTKAHYGVCFSFRQYLKVKGLGYFIKPDKKLAHVACLIFGRSSDEYFQLPEPVQLAVKPKKKKYAYKLNCTNEQLLNTLCKQLRTKESPDSYRAKGIRFVKEKLVIRPGKKKK